MPGMTNTHEAECLQHMLNATEYPYGTNRFIGLFSADPGETGSLTNEEGVGQSAREAITFNLASAGSTSNDALIQVNTTGWSGTDLTHFGLSAASTRGTDPITWFGALTGAPISYTPGDILDIPIGNIVVNFGDEPGGSPGTKVTAVGANKWIDHSLHTAQWTGLLGPQVSLHTAAPATSGNEFTAPDYARTGGTFTNAGTSGDFSTLTHTNTISFTNINDTPLRAWGIWNGTDLIVIRDQGSNTTVSPGANIDAPPGRLVVSVN